MSTPADILITSMTEPLSTITISSGPFGWIIDTDVKTAEADVIKAGMLVYNNNAKVVTRCPALYGKTSMQGQIRVVDVQADTIYLSGDYNIKDAYPTGVSVRTIILQLGNQFWVRANSLTAKAHEILVSAANGLVTNNAQTGAAADDADKKAFGFKVLKSVTAKNWVAVEHMGIVAIDTSA